MKLQACGEAGIPLNEKKSVKQSTSAAVHAEGDSDCGGGLVYFAMFRRPLVSTPNLIWRFIQSFQEEGPRVRDIPSGVISELVMFLCLLPLAHMDFRTCVS